MAVLKQQGRRSPFDNLEMATPILFALVSWLFVDRIHLIHSHFAFVVRLSQNANN